MQFKRSLVCPCILVVQLVLAGSRTEALGNNISDEESNVVPESQGKESKVFPIEDHQLTKSAISNPTPYLISLKYLYYLDNEYSNAQSESNQSSDSRESEAFNTDIQLLNDSTNGKLFFT